MKINEKDAKTKNDENAEQSTYKLSKDPIPFLIYFMKNQPMKSRKFIFIENKKERKINILFTGQLYATVANSLFNYVRFFEKSKPENIKNK